MTLVLVFKEACKPIVCSDYGGNVKDLIDHVVEISSVCFIVLYLSIGIFTVLFP
jgi:hypothetical protein